MMELAQIAAAVTAAAEELITAAQPKPGRIFVLGCSTSEVLGSKIGTARSPETAEAILTALLAVTRAHGLYLAVQCCEHLNRALVTERAVCEKYRLDQVWVVPQPHAGGSCATAAYRLMDDPVVVERIAADSGVDIGGTMIGMHLMDVAIPLRLSIDQLGQAHMAFARTRPKLIGGPRAVYQDQDIR